MNFINKAHLRKAVLLSTAALLSLSSLMSACMKDDADGSPAEADEPAAQAPDGETVQFTLKTALDGSSLAFMGVGGEIDAQHNPDLAVATGSEVEVTLENGDGSLHDITFEGFDVTSEQVGQVGDSDTISFSAGEAGSYAYYCTLPGHRTAGMEGTFTVGEGGAEAAVAIDISRPPDDLPEPVGAREAQTLQVALESVELEGQLADGTTYTYWTFNGQVPGPMVRVRVGDTVELTLSNAPDSANTHSIDLHAVTGPGGGAVATQVTPGDSRTFTFKALNPGLYVYHCATPSVAHHIASGMYGMILVEPEGGLPPVDHEFYVMQGEIYTKNAFGAQGHQETDASRIVNENPRYVVMNGSVGALTDRHPLKAQVGETVRIYFGVGGPNFISSFHVIGEIFDRVYDQASLTSVPLTDVQTTLVAPGGATVVEFQLQVPGRYILVDHALGRLERGGAGFLEVEGAENHDIFHAPEGETAGSGH